LREGGGGRGGGGKGRGRRGKREGLSHQSKSTKICPAFRHPLPLPYLLSPLSLSISLPYSLPPSWGPTSVVQLEGLGSAVSPAAKRFVVHFELKRALLVIAIPTEFFCDTTCC